MCVYLHVFVCESDSKPMSEHSLIGAAGALRGRLIENASDTRLQPSLAQHYVKHTPASQAG